MIDRIDADRRRLLRYSAAGLLSLSLATVGRAQTRRVNESDPLARQLGYKINASKVDTAKFPKRAGPEGAQQLCRNCQFYHGAAGSAWGPCTVFGNRLVSAGGWCNSWFGRSG